MKTFLTICLLIFGFFNVRIFKKKSWKQNSKFSFQLCNGQSCNVYATDPNTRLIVTATRQPLCRVMDEYNAYKSAVLIAADYEFNKPLASYYGLVEALRNVGLRFKEMYEDTAIADYMTRMKGFINSIILKFFKINLLNIVASLRGSLDLYLGAESYVLFLVTGLNPNYEANEMRRSTLYFNLLNSLERHWPECMNQYARNISIEMGTNTDAIVMCFRDGRTTVQQQLVPLFRAIIQGFTDAVNFVTARMIPCRYSANFADSIQCVRGAVREILLGKLQIYTN